MKLVLFDPRHFELGKNQTLGQKLMPTIRLPWYIDICMYRWTQEISPLCEGNQCCYWETQIMFCKIHFGVKIQF